MGAVARGSVQLSEHAVGPPARKRTRRAVWPPSWSWRMPGARCYARRARRASFKRLLGAVSLLGTAKYLTVPTRWVSLVREHLNTGYDVTAAQRSAHDLVCVVLATVSGLGIGWLDLHTTEVLATIVPLLTAGAVLGLLRPKAAWRWAVLIALGLPVMAAIGKLSGMRTVEPVQLDPRVTLVALAVALLGSYTGALVRRAASGIAGAA